MKYIKETNHFLPKVPLEAAAASGSQQRTPGLRRLSEIGGYAAIIMSGASPSLIVRTSKSMPHVFSIKSDFIRGISGFDSTGCERGLIYVDDEVFPTFRLCVLEILMIRSSALFELASYMIIRISIFHGLFAEYL